MTNTIDAIVKKRFRGARNLTFPLVALHLFSCNTDRKDTTTIPELPTELEVPTTLEEETVTSSVTLKDIPAEEYTCKQKIISDGNLATFCLYANTGGYGDVFSRDGRLAILGDVSYNHDSSDIIIATFSAYILDSSTKEANRILLPNVSGGVT